VDGGAGGLEGERVHDFDRAGEQAAGDDGRDGVTGLLEGAVAGEDGMKHLGARQELHGDFKGDAEKAFIAGEQAAPVGAELLAGSGAEFDDLAGGEHGFEPEHVIGSHAVF
jgi:hypothetical protein